MDVLFFAFANDRDQPLPTLEREDETIYSLLAPRQAQLHFLIHRDSFTSIEKLAEYLTLYRHNIVLFHYSGHAGMDHLALDEEEARALGLAELLGKCPRLRAVILNGCSTAGQVALLRQKNIPVVVATSAPVEDDKATEFAIQFYRSLANMENLREAFDASRAKILTMHDQITFQRGLIVPGQAAQAVWGLFYEENMQEALDWTLPASVAISTSTGEFRPNELLLDSLIQALAEYNEEVRKIWENQTLGVSASILDKRESALKCLPHPVSEQLRKLLVPEATGTGAFYDKPGIARLTQMTAVFDTILELMGFIMLAQLWDALSQNEELIVPDPTRDCIRHFLGLTPAERRNYDFFPLITCIRGVLDTNNIPYFVEELSYLREIFREGEPFYDSCRFMESVKKQLQANTVGKGEAESLCILGEEHLARVLGELGFVARYTFASVKNIDVVKYRHIKEARFRHTVVRLIQRFVGLAEEMQVLERFMDTTSVLLIHERDGKQRFLNLTPFIIDENAFDEKASIAKLHYFDRYVRDQDAYAYRHIYKPGDVPLVVSRQPNYLVLKAQFEAFSQLLFHLPMRQAI